jgi:hypothetical protein
MTDSNEPKTETVRIDPPPQAVSQPSAPDTRSRETVRIQLGPLTGPSPSLKTADQALPSSPNKETARIPRMPDLASKPPATVQMKKTQPLIAMPHAAPAKPSILVAPAEKNVMLLCWVLLGVSAIILIIQIWTYFS